MPAKTPATQNAELQLARDFVQYTRHHIFLTGKAGTGKTTFLHQLKQHTPKRMIVTAPTGVAAINAGGVTLHSFFQLPFGPYVPGSDMQQRGFSKEKINIIKSLDLLVIDEISMVRADVLDSVDAVLRRYKHRQRPFGGVQLLMIGDLHQLAPVIKDDEWQLLKPYYDSCYFFSSHALHQTDMISIELKHIYRQSDANFIALLNRVRDNQLDAAVLHSLNTRYLPDFQPAENQDYITLTTHNRNADNINERQLQSLPSKPFRFAARIEGDYPAYSYPTAEQLTLKAGAQVMFVRNDASPEKRYFNGKIGQITGIDQEHIKVTCPDEKDAILVAPCTWENIQYTLDPTTREITPDVIGSFTQYPLRLAWAITIHKSQGLTFERAIIDAQAAFSHGQVYVALSRCKTFEGLVLSTPLTQGAVKTDSTVAQFVDQASQHPPTQQQLTSARIFYQQQLLLECFDFQTLASGLKNLGNQLREHGALVQTTAPSGIEAMEKLTSDDIIIVAGKFRRQLQALFERNTVPEDDAAIQQRVQKAAHYFLDKLQSGLIRWTSGFGFDTDNKDIKKHINQTLVFLRHQLVVKTGALQSCHHGFATHTYLNALALAEIAPNSPPPTKKPADDTITADVQHPQLLQALKTWRAKQAAEEQLEHYRILHQRVLLQIARLLPATPDALRQINGVGRATLEKYGAAITAIVSEYCRAHAIVAQAMPEQTINKPTVTKSAAKKDTKRISYELFLQGKSLQEIADTRGLVRNTIEGHLAHFVSLGELDIHDIVSKEKIALIKQAVAEQGGASLNLIKEHLGDAFSYGEIRLVVASLD
ncbi:MAG: helix-turn-helix domain-containing protein [Gammaproteobacteria bacterium]|nr:helix-turn-helix domain-containing protein [Gammaproteobacteria bacterium]